MIKAVLADDERKSILTLKKLLGKYCSDFIIVGEADNITDAVEIIKQKDPDVVFLDIEMMDGTGFDLLKKFDNPLFLFIFVTAHSRYAVKAFKHSATDYLLKPVDVDDLKRATDRIRNLIRNEIVLKKFGSDKGKMVKLRIKNEFLYVSSDQIIRLKAIGSYTKITLINNREHVISINLGTLEEKLGNGNFIRIHRSDIININHIMRIVKTDALYAEMTGGSRVEISRRNKTFLFERLKENDDNNRL
ncbi:MAG TPA: LytTR family DNA-binding domain-containing protein [Chitinophagaceae bacterium]|nr:LytTR family DNA-binding domain-containing protein [Chitinophagaceae bacterium]